MYLLLFRKLVILLPIYKCIKLKRHHAPRFTYQIERFSLIAGFALLGLSLTQPIYGHAQSSSATTNASTISSESQSASSNSDATSANSAQITQAEAVQSQTSSDRTLSDSSTSIENNSSSTKTADSVSSSSTSKAKTIASGTDGTANFTLTDDGTLSFDGGTLSATDTHTLGQTYGKLITTIDTSHATSKVVLPEDASQLFATTLDASGQPTSGFQNLTTFDTTNLDTSNVINMDMMFANDAKLAVLDTRNFKLSKVASMAMMFVNDRSLSTLDVTNWDTSLVTNMSQLFANDTQLNNLDVSQWDTSHVTNMAMMFSGDSALSQLDVSNWQTANVTDMTQMFDNDTALTTLDVAKWDTANVTTMAMMFNQDSALTALDVSNWQTANVINMDMMFANNTQLTHLDVANWNTQKVTDIGQVFAGMASLQTLDLTNWQTANVNVSASFINNDNALTSITFGSYFTTSVDFPGVTATQGWLYKRAPTKLLAQYDGTKSGTYFLVDAGQSGQIGSLDDGIRVRTQIPDAVYTTRSGTLDNGIRVRTQIPDAVYTTANDTQPRPTNQPQSIASTSTGLAVTPNTQLTTTEVSSNQPDDTTVAPIKQVVHADAKTPNQVSEISNDHQSHRPSINEQQLPQTSEQQPSWVAWLGITLLTILSLPILKLKKFWFN